MGGDTAAEQTRRNAMRQARAAMEQTARDQASMTYTELVDQLTTRYTPNGKPLSDLLCEISRQAHKRGDGMIAAVVVKASDDLPGEGFYPVARELGIQGIDDADLHANALTEVWEIWAQRDSP